MKIQPKKMRARRGAQSPKYTYQAVPDALTKVSLVVPPGCDIRDMFWFDQERNAEAGRALLLTDSEFKKWLDEQQDSGTVSEGVRS